MIDWQRFFRGMWSAIDKRDTMVQARYAKQALAKERQFQSQQQSEHEKVPYLFD